MGQSGSRAVRNSNGIIVTLDALGTLYKFRKPFAVQYLEIGEQAGVKHGIDPDQLQQAFKKAYKEQVAVLPNYGKCQLNDPSEWWNLLVKKTFSQMVDDVPSDLPRRLYQHFSSADAYELHSDVVPFLQTIHNLRNQLSNPNGPSLLTGIITNSDPRVAEVLRSLSVNVGNIKLPTREAIRETATASAKSGVLQTPWSDAYNPTNDFDFLVTGYEAGVEKPDPGIWQFANLQASFVAISKSQMNMQLTGGRIGSALSLVANAMNNMNKTDNMRWIHIGDEYDKDYAGAKSVGKEALLLDRECAMEEKADKISSLEEAAMVLNLITQEMVNEK